MDFFLTVCATLSGQRFTCASHVPSFFYVQSRERILFTIITWALLCFFTACSARDSDLFVYHCAIFSAGMKSDPIKRTISTKSVADWRWIKVNSAARLILVKFLPEIKAPEMDLLKRDCLRQVYAVWNRVAKRKSDSISGVRNCTPNQINQPIRQWLCR